MKLTGKAAIGKKFNGMSDPALTRSGGHERFAVGTARCCPAIERTLRSTSRNGRDPLRPLAGGDHGRYDQRGSDPSRGARR